MKKDTFRDYLGFKKNRRDVETRQNKNTGPKGSSRRRDHKGDWKRRRSSGVWRG